jgi:hypothetical protein
LQALSSPDFNNALSLLLATHPQGPFVSTSTSNFHFHIPIPHPSAVQLTPLTRKSLSPPSHAAQQPLLLASTCPALLCPTRPWLSCLSCLSLPLLSCPILVSPAYPAVHYPAALLTLHTCSAHLVPCLFCCSRRRLALRCLWTQPHLPALSVCQFGDACLYPLSFPRWASHGGVGCYSFKRPPAPSCGSISATGKGIKSYCIVQACYLAHTWTWSSALLASGTFKSAAFGSSVQPAASSKLRIVDAGHLRDLCPYWMRCAGPRSARPRPCTFHFILHGDFVPSGFL